MTIPLSALIPVLVVDDSAVSRKLVEHALEQQPYSRIFAKDGAEAERLFAQYSPRIVITDWMLPDISGPDLCRRLRASARAYTYLIILTSNTNKENLVEGLSAGADDYITKPFDRQELLARIGVGRRTIELHSLIEAKNLQLEALARTDHLTGLLNRRAVEDYGTRQLHGASRHNFSFWLVLMDIDNFKSINDSCGHLGGDAVIVRVGELLRSRTRNSDICGRLGGDEFVLGISYATQEGIAKAIERVRELIACETIPTTNGPVHITASFGLAGFQGGEAQEFKHLLERADRALYTAKRAGGNQLKVDDARVPAGNPA